MILFKKYFLYVYLRQREIKCILINQDFSVYIYQEAVFCSPIQSHPNLALNETWIPCACRCSSRDWEMMSHGKGNVERVLDLVSFGLDTF